MCFRTVATNPDFHHFNIKLWLGNRCLLNETILGYIRCLAYIDLKHVIVDSPHLNSPRRVLYSALKMLAFNCISYSLLVDLSCLQAVLSV